MLIEAMMTIVIIIIQAIFSFLGVLPAMPTELITALDGFFDLLFVGAGVVSLFVPMDTVRVLVPIVITIINFDKILRLIMFVLRKIPLLGIE